MKQADLTVRHRDVECVGYNYEAHAENSDFAYIACEILINPGELYYDQVKPVEQ